MGRVGLAPLRKPGCPHIFIDRGFQSRPVCRVCAVSRTTARPVPGLRGTGEPGVGSLPEARGLWLCLSPLVQFPWSNRGLSPPSSDPPGVRHGRPFDLSASRRRRSRGLRRLAAHPHRVRSAGRRQRPSPSPRGILGDGSPPPRRRAESISQLRDRHVTQALCRLAYCSVRSQSTSKEVTRHR